MNILEFNTNIHDPRMMIINREFDSIEEFERWVKNEFIPVIDEVLRIEIRERYWADGALDDISIQYEIINVEEIPPELYEDAQDNRFLWYKVTKVYSIIIGVDAAWDHVDEEDYSDGRFFELYVDYIELDGLEYPQLGRLNE